MDISYSNKIIVKLANKYKIDKRVANYIIRYSFKYLRDFMQSDNDGAIMFPYFGKFAKKNIMISIHKEKPEFNRPLIIRYYDAEIDGRKYFMNAVALEDGYMHVMNEDHSAGDKIVEIDKIQAWRYAL